MPRKPVWAFLKAYSNSDFTNPHEVLLPDGPKDCRNDFTHMGVKYTGLETCRHLATRLDKSNSAFTYFHHSFNWLHIGFKERILIDEIQISTRWFTGNQVRAISITLEDELADESFKVLDRVNLNPDSEHVFSIKTDCGATSCLVQLFHEGGISRIHFFGEKTFRQLPKKTNLLEKATISHVSNEHYGNPRMAVFGNRKEMHMVGWESARTGFGEQALFHLKHSAVLDEIVVDTYLHRLNAPLTCHIFGAFLSTNDDIEAFLQKAPKWMLTFEDGQTIIPDDFQNYMLNNKYLNVKVANPDRFRISLSIKQDGVWKAILPFEPLEPDTYNSFTKLENRGPFTHILYLHYPNGGIHGLKVFGIEQSENI